MCYPSDTFHPCRTSPQLPLHLDHFQTTDHCRRLRHPLHRLLHVLVSSQSSNCMLLHIYIYITTTRITFHTAYQDHPNQCKHHSSHYRPSTNRTMVDSMIVMLMHLTSHCCRLVVITSVLSWDMHTHTNTHTCGHGTDEPNAIAAFNLLPTATEP
jgi:hypothetical protein